MQEQLLILGGRIMDPSQKLDMVGDIFIADGTIKMIGDVRQAGAPGHLQVFNARGMIVCPGFIDLHCHLREPGNEDKETISTGTRAAARGGFTTVCAMANTQPPIDNVEAVELIKRKASLEGAVRVLPIGCITKGRKGQHLVEVGDLEFAGVVALSDDGDPVRDPNLMREALEYGHTFGLPIIDHCEDTAASAGGMMNDGALSARLGLKGIPAAAEERIVARDIMLAQETGAHLHIAHVSTAGSVELIRRAKEKGLHVTAEVTPHHLMLTEKNVLLEDGETLDTNAKVNPPLRTGQDVKALIAGLKAGVIDAIATDHAPHTDADKNCAFEEAACGISGLETAFASVISLYHRGDLELKTIISKLTVEPANVIQQRELGTLVPGAPADITVFDPNAQWTVDPSAFISKGRNTPLAGIILKGRVMATIYGGRFRHRIML